MEFRFPGWGMSLKEKGRAGAEALAAPAAQHSAWRRDDLDDLSGDEVWQPHPALITRPLSHCSALPSETAQECVWLRLSGARDSPLCCSQEDASAPTPDAAQGRSLQARRDAAADSGVAATPSSPCASGEQPGKRGGAAAAARITDLPDALLRKVLCLLTQRAALPAALACSALRQACLSDEVWSAWSAGAPPPLRRHRQPLLAAQSRHRLSARLCWHTPICPRVRRLSAKGAAGRRRACVSLPQATQRLARSQSAPSPPGRARTRRARARQAPAPRGRPRCPPPWRPRPPLRAASCRRRRADAQTRRAPPPRPATGRQALARRRKRHRVRRRPAGAWWWCDGGRARRRARCSRASARSRRPPRRPAPALARAAPPQTSCPAARITWPRPQRWQARAGLLPRPSHAFNSYSPVSSCSSLANGPLLPYLPYLQSI